tara:strand:+ start:237 stop:560 length:324 start_codon:yes stop_codon:yes gene_type:complete
MTKKIIGYDPIQKKTTYFHGGNDGQHYVSVEQETKHIINKAKNLDIDYKPYDLVGSQKHMRQIAEIPANLFFELKTKLGDPKHNKKAWARWLNDPDNKFFRTGGGKI